MPAAAKKAKTAAGAGGGAVLPGQPVQAPSAHPQQAAHPQHQQQPAAPQVRPKFFTHRPVSTLDRVPFQLTDELFLYGMALNNRRLRSSVLRPRSRCPARRSPRSPRSRRRCRRRRPRSRPRRRPRACRCASARGRTSRRRSARIRRVRVALVLTRPRRRRGERRSLRTFSPAVRLSPPRVPRFQSRHTSTPFNSASDAPVNSTPTSL